MLDPFPRDGAALLWVFVEIFLLDHHAEPLLRLWNGTRWEKRIIWYHGRSDAAARCMQTIVSLFVHKLNNGLIYSPTPGYYTDTHVM